MAGKPLHNLYVHFDKAICAGQYLLPITLMWWMPHTGHARVAVLGCGFRRSPTSPGPVMSAVGASAVDSSVVRACTFIYYYIRYSSAATEGGRASEGATVRR